MREKDYKKKFKEMFGVDPFTEDEIRELKAMLFEMGSDMHVIGNLNIYSRYYPDYEYICQKEEQKRQEDEQWEELASFAH